MSFDRALQFVLKAEGGFVDDPSDSGGPTKYGITQATYDAFLKEHKTVKGITYEEARNIYQFNYWAASHCDAMPDELATVVFDTAVNSGCQRAIKILQSCLDVNADGIFGKETQSAIEDIPDLKDFVSKYLSERSAFVQRLTELRTENKKFLKGWLNRVENLREFIFT